MLGARWTAGMRCNKDEKRTFAKTKREKASHNQMPEESLTYLVSTKLGNFS